MTSRLIGPTAAAIVKPSTKPRSANAGSTGTPFGREGKKTPSASVPGRHSGWWSAPIGARSSGRGGPGGPLLRARGGRVDVMSAQGGGRRRLSMGRARYPSTMTTTTGRPLKVGIQLPEVEREVRWAGAARHDPRDRGPRLRFGRGSASTSSIAGRIARRAGRGRRGPCLPAIAAVTSRIELGPLVACTNFHNPALLAKQAMTIDEISGGRFVLGLGAGWNETEFRAYGYPFDHRIDRFEEAFTIIRTLLREGAIDFDGRWYQARDCELLPRGPRAGRPAADDRVERAADAARDDGPRRRRGTPGTTTSRTGPTGVPPIRDLVDEACREVGRDPAEVERTVAVLVRLPGGAGRLQGDVAQARDRRRSTASPQSWRTTLRAFAREGIAHVQLVVDPITLGSIVGLGPMLADLDRGRVRPAAAGPKPRASIRRDAHSPSCPRAAAPASLERRRRPPGAMSLPARSPRSRAVSGRASDEVSPLDKRIIEHLQADGRRPFTQIAADLGVSEAAVRARTNRLIERGILQVVGVTDPLKLGFHQMAMIGIRCESAQADRGRRAPRGDARGRLRRHHRRHATTS